MEESENGFYSSFISYFNEMNSNLKKIFSMDEENPKRIYIFHILMMGVILTASSAIFSIQNKVPLDFAQLAAILASLLAIIFAISLVAVQILANNYSPRILNIYTENYCVILTVVGFLGSILVLIIYSRISYPSQFLQAICFGVFFLCTYVFLNYFYEILKIIDPIKLAEIIKIYGNRAIVSKNYSKGEMYISAVGDITLKTVKRNEELVAEKYLEVLWNFFEASVKSDLKKNIRTTPNFFSYEKYQNLPNSINNEYQRIYKAGVLANESTITQTIMNIYGHMLYKSITGDEELFKEILQYNTGLFALSFERSDESKFTFINKVATIPGMFINNPDEDKIKNYQNYLHPYCLSLNSLILDNNDLPAFQYEIESFDHWNYPSPFQIKQELDHLTIYDFYWHTSHSEEKAIIHNEIINRKKNIATWAEVHSFLKFETYQRFKERTYELKKYCELSRTTIQESRITNNELVNNLSRVIGEVKQLNRLAFQLYLTTLFHRSFFIIGSYILHKSQESSLEEEGYLTALWNRPRTANNVMEIRNPMIVFNPNWLTSVLIYGGIDDRNWWHRFRLFVDMSITDDNLNLFYLLCLSNIDANQKRLNLPNRPELEKFVLDTDGKQILREYYDYANDFVNIADDLKKSCEILIQTGTKYNYLLNNQANERFQDTNNWIDESIIRFSQLITDIESITPIDPGKIKKYQMEIYDNFNELNKLDEIIPIREYNPSSDSRYEFIKLYVPKNLTRKRNFIDISDVPIYGLGRAVALTIMRGEYKYIGSDIIRQKVEHKTINLVSSVELSKQIHLIVKNYCENIHETITVFTSKDIFRHLLENQLINVLGQMKIGEGTIVRVIDIEKIPANNIVIFNKGAGELITKSKSENGSRLIVNITEYTKEKLKVFLEIYELVYLQIIKPEEIEVFEIHYDENKLHNETLS